MENYLKVNKQMYFFLPAVVAIGLLVIVLFVFSLARSAQAAYGLNPSVRQVKTVNSPTVYYLDHARGRKKVYVNEKSFLAYGNKWSDIKIINQKDLDKWPEMHLVKTKDSHQVYYINNKRKAAIESEQRFIDLGFDWQDIATILPTDLDQYELSDYDLVKSSAYAPAAAEDAANNNTANAAVAAGVLKITPLVISSANGDAIPTGSRGNIAAAFRISAEKKDAVITNLTLRSYGMSSDNLIALAYLTDRGDKVLGDKNIIVNRQLVLNFTLNPITIPAGQDKIFLIKVDVKPLSNVAGQTLGFSILSPLDIGTTAIISASFPIKAEVLKIADGTGNLGRLDISDTALNTTVKTVKTGVKNQTVGGFRLSETSGNEDAVIEKIILTNLGGALDADLKNIKLVSSSGSALAVVPSMINKRAVFELTRPLILAKKQAINFTIKLDIAAGDGRDIKFAINDSDDIIAYGYDSQFDVITTVTKSGADINRSKIERTPLFLTSLNFKNNFAYVYSDQSDAVIGIFELRNGAADLKLQSVKLAITASKGALSPADELIVFNYQTGAAISTNSLTQPRLEVNTARDMKLNNYLVKQGQTLRLAFAVRIPGDALRGDRYGVSIDSLTYVYDIDNNNTPFTDSFNLNSPTVQVLEPTVYFTAGKFTNDDLALAVSGRSNVKIGTFRIEASSDESVKITNLTIANLPGFTAVNYGNGFANLAIYANGSRASDIIGQPNGEAYEFNTNFTVSAGRALDLTVRVDTDSRVQGQVKLALENARIQGLSSGVSSQILNKNIAGPEIGFSQTVLSAQIANSGSLAKGVSGNTIASFILTNQAKETIRLNKVVVVTEGNGGNISSTNGFNNLRFVQVVDESKTKPASSAVNAPVIDSNDLNFNGLSIPAGQTATVNLLIDTAKDAELNELVIFIRELNAKGAFSGVDAAVQGIPTDFARVIVE